jgi:peroxiredoxin (alkyl hydroperoxide reductase subunit C)
MVADMTREITSAYGVLSEPGNSYYPAGVAMRATFVIDQQGIVRHQVVNDEPLGRSVDEVIRNCRRAAIFRGARSSVSGGLE